MNEPEDEEPLDPGPAAIRLVELTADDAGGRLDRALTDKLPELSRARVQALMAQGQVRRGDVLEQDPSARALAATYEVRIPPAAPALPQPEDLPLNVLFEDEHLIVIDKAAGMAAHPAPGSESGTLVNALLRHCGASLSGIGGVARPGIVHRLDKDTSGVLVAAKTDIAHRGLAKLFETHDIERVYIAFTRGAPRPAEATIETRLGRSPRDRKKMAVLAIGGREATTHYRTLRIYGAGAKPPAAKVACTLETGRTHQIRVHMASKGAPLLGDPLYGAGAPSIPVRAAIAEAGLTRQALHAAVLGFVHPVSGAPLRFESALPPDLAALEKALEGL